MATQVEICNRALGLFGQGAEIASIDDPSESARMCKRFWDGAVDALLSGYPWGFAIARVALAADAQAPAFGYSCRYQLPEDCMEVLGIAGETHQSDYRVEGGFILCNEDGISIRYSRRVSDAALFPVMFAEALAALLAFQMAGAATGSVNRTQLLYSIYERRLAAARHWDARQSFRPVEHISWITARS